MDILLIVFWAFFMCLVVALIIFTFPSSFARDSMKQGTQKIQLRFIIVDVVVCIVAIALNKAPCISITSIEIRTSLMLIPVIACLVFSIFLYYPSIRFLVKMNLADQKTIDQLITCLFKCAYSEKAERDVALRELNLILKDEEQFNKQYGLVVYLAEYINQAKYTTTNKPSESIINCVLDRCNQVKHDIDGFVPIPFPNIGLVLSFAFSTILTILLSIITITP